MAARARSVAGFVLALLALAAAGRAVRADDPTDRAAIEHRVRADLDKAYAAFAAEESGWLPPYQAEIDALASEDPARRAAAGDYLATLARTTDADARAGRTPRRKGWSLGLPQDVGDEVRYGMASSLSRAPLAGDGGAALEVALWLVKEERLERLRGDGARTVVRIRHPDADAAIVALAAEPHPTYAVLEIALRAIRDRKLAAGGDAVRALSAHYRPEIAKAATEAAVALQITDAPSFDAKAPLPPSILRRLSTLASLVADPIPPGTPWKRLRFAGAVSSDFDAWGGRTEATAWILSRAGGKHRLVDTFGHAFEVTSANLTEVDESLAASAEALIAARAAATTSDDREKARAFTDQVGMHSFVVHQGPWTGSLPEALLAAWCAAAGHAVAARDLVMPLLLAHDDERGLFDLAFDQLASRIDRDMLDAFTNRDPDRALALARHLSSPAFEAFRAHARAKDLLAEIPRRGDDFRTLALPSEAAWSDARRKLSREQQVEYLAARLRLIHDVQYDIPGGVSWTAVQYDAPGDASRWWSAPKGERDAHRVINPYAELSGMDLCGAEVAKLIPWLSSEDHILAYDLPRFMPHFPQSLHRVRWLVASIVDGVLGDGATDLKVIEGRDAEARQRHVAVLVGRAEAQGPRRESDRRAQELALGTEERALQTAYGRLETLDPAKGMRALLSRASRDPDRRAEWVRLAYALDALTPLDGADRLLADPDEEIAFWAAASLLRRGAELGRKRGLDHLLASLGSGDPHARIDVVLDDLLATKDPRVAALLDRYLAATPDVRHTPTALVLQRALLLGRKDAFLRLLDGIEGRGLLPLRAYDQEGKSLPMLSSPPRYNLAPPSEADLLAERVVGWFRPDAKPAPLYGEDETSRALRLAEARKALYRALAEIQEGRPPVVELEERPRPLGEWLWVSSGWVLRTR